jgi:hypothetical protein
MFIWIYLLVAISLILLIIYPQLSHSTIRFISTTVLIAIARIMSLSIPSHKQTAWSESASELYQLSDPEDIGEVSANFCG